MTTLPTMYDDADLARVKVVATDMDNTLLADDGSMPPGMFDRIRALARAGIVFCAASGRSGYTLRTIFDGVVDDMGLICDNGGSIYHRGERVFADLIDAPDYHELIDFALDDGRGCLNLCALDACYILERDRRYDDYFSSFYSKIVYVDSFDGIDVDTDKFTVFFPEADAERVFLEAYRDRWSDRYSVTNAGANWIDFMNPGVDKGTGLARICERLGVSTADALAFGDTYNDIEMLECAGHGYVVRNAADHMRSHARFECPSNNERGVAQVIDRLLELAG